MLVLLLAALPWQETAHDPDWLVRSDSRPEERVEEARQGEDGWLLPPIPPDGTARAARTFTREEGAVEVEFRFTLGEEAATSWALTLEHPDGPGEVPLLQVRVDFDPVGGATWTAAVRGAEGRARAFSLEEPPEPEGLRHHLKLRLPAEGGVDLRFADGHPLFVTPLGTGAAARLVLSRRGPVSDLAVRGPRSTPSLVSGELAALSRRRAGTRARPTLPAMGPGDHLEWHYALDWLPDLLEFEPLTAVDTREVEPVRTDAFVVRRLVLTLRPRVEVPVLVWEPAAGLAEGSPGVLLLPPRQGAGKTEEWAVSLAAALAARGCQVLVPDEIGQGERIEFQPHDGLYHPLMELVGGRMAALVVQEQVAFLDVLRRERPGAPLALIGGAGTRESCQLTAALSGDLQALVLPGDAPTEVSFGSMPPGFARHRLQLGRQRSMDPEHVQESEDPAAIDQRMARWFGLPAPSPIPSAPPAEQELLFGPLQVGSLWYSWILDQALQRNESRTRSDQPLTWSLRRCVTGQGHPIPRQEPTLTVERAAPGQDWFLWSRPEDLAWTGLRVQAEGPEAEPGAGALLRRGPGPVTLAVGEVGKVETLERIQGLVEPRPGETWVSLTIPLVGPGDDDCHDAVVRCSWADTPLIGLLAADLGGFLGDRVRENDGQPLRLVGQGVGGLLALIVAAQQPDDVEQVVLVECPPSLAMLLDGEPRLWSPRPPPPVRSRHPSSLWYVPDLLAHLDLEDLVLALMDQGVEVRMEHPVDRRLRPLGRRDRLAMWPRVRHRQWQSTQPSGDGR